MGTRLIVTLVVGSVVVAACSDRSATTVATTATFTTVTVDPPPIPVVLDYSTTTSDIGALLYLATNPAVDLRAVTLPGTGEADCIPGTQITRAILRAIDRSEVPVGCTDEQPISGDRDWPPEWRDAANRFVAVTFPTVTESVPDDAHELLAATLERSDERVTVVAVGPLTNVARVLDARPTITTAIRRIVVMGGAIGVAGNVDSAPDAEWNLHIDPEAARRVLAHDVEVLLVPLDATRSVPWTPALAARTAVLATSAGAIEAAMTSTASLDGLYLWDELTAVVAVRPEVASIEEHRLAILDDGSTVTDPTGASVLVASSVDADAAVDAWLTVLAAGDEPVIPPGRR